MDALYNTDYAGMIKHLFDRMSHTLKSNLDDIFEIPGMGPTIESILYLNMLFMARNQVAFMKFKVKSIFW